MGKMKELDIKVREVRDGLVRFAKKHKKILISASVGGVVETITKVYFVGKDGTCIGLRNSKDAGKVYDAIDRLGKNSEDLRLVLGAYEGDVYVLADAENKNSDAAFNRINRVENVISGVAGLGAAGLTKKVLDQIWPDEEEESEEE